MFEFIQAILTRIAQAPCLSNNSMTSRHLKTTMFLKFREEFECPQFPKLPLLRCPNFLRFFLPFPFRWVLPAGFGALGPRLPRLHTAALRSRERPHFRRRAAHRGQGSGGCAGQHRPWPRTQDLGRKTFLRQWDRCEESG